MIANTTTCHVETSGESSMTQSPLQMRGLHLCETLDRHTPEQIDRLLDRMVQWEMNTLMLISQYGFERHGQRVKAGCEARGLALIDYLQTSVAVLGDVPEEWIAVGEDGRALTRPGECETRICVSRPEAVAWYADGIVEFVRRHRVSDRMVMIDADGYGFCRCHTCRNLPPVDHWASVLSAVLDRFEHEALPVELIYLAYVWRYRLPTDRSILGRLGGVMFDTHQRDRRAAIGSPHSLNGAEALEAQVDPAAAGVPINRYLFDRLKEWRAAYAGPIAVFENLMVQGSLSCPQPYTLELLEDLRRYHEVGVQGVMYEAFAPGMETFEPQLATLAAASAGRPVDPKPTALERAWRAADRTGGGALEVALRSDALAWLTSQEFDAIAALQADRPSDEALVEHCRRMRRFLRDRDAASGASVMQWVLEHPDRFDWAFICFAVLKRVDVMLPPRVAEVVGYAKLWDWMRRTPDPLAAALETFTAGADSLVEHAARHSAERS